jgi:hypothetical protein
MQDKEIWKFGDLEMKGRLSKDFSASLRLCGKRNQLKSGQRECRIKKFGNLEIGDLEMKGRLSLDFSAPLRLCGKRNQLKSGQRECI